MLPWREAWHEALYGPRGFYRRAEGPAGHFTTVDPRARSGALFAEALGRLADREGAHHVVDVGCGRGELLAHARTRRRPTCGSPASTSSPARPTCRMPWPGSRSPGGARLPDGLTDLDDVLVVAHEWLDVVPCTVAEVVAPGRLAVVLVDPATGAESTRRPARADDELAWCARHWPVDDLPVGDARRGRPDPRRGLGATSSARVRRGILLAVDYGHTAGDRPAGGTLTAYRDGAPGRRRCRTGRATSPRTSPSTRSSTTSSPPSGRPCARSGWRRHARRTTWPAPTRPATSRPWRAPRPSAR